MLRSESEDISQLYANKPKLKPHFLNMISSFCTKASVEHCSIIVNYNKITEEYGSWNLDGYEIPNSEQIEQQSGLKSWPSIYTFPLVSLKLLSIYCNKITLYPFRVMILHYIYRIF